MKHQPHNDLSELESLIRDAAPKNVSPEFRQRLNQSAPEINQSDNSENIIQHKFGIILTLVAAAAAIAVMLVLRTEPTPQDNNQFANNTPAIVEPILIDRDQTIANSTNYIREANGIHRKVQRQTIFNTSTYKKSPDSPQYSVVKPVVTSRSTPLPIL